MLLNKELITNGDFSAWSEDASPADVPTGWAESPGVNTAANHTTEAIADGTPTDGGGHCKLKSDGTNVMISQVGVAIVGKKYLASVTITNVTDGSIRFGNGAQSSTDFSTVATHTWKFTAESSNFLVKRHAGVTDVTFDDVSVREDIPIGLSRTGHRFSSFPEN